MKGIYLTVMTRGLSKSQVIILGLLAKTGGLDTPEIVEVLSDQGIIKQGAPRKQQMYTVVRACKALARRGLVVGNQVTHADYPWAKTIHWVAKKRNPSDE